MPLCSVSTVLSEQLFVHFEILPIYTVSMPNFIFVLAVAIPMSSSKVDPILIMLAGDAGDPGSATVIPRDDRLQ